LAKAQEASTQKGLSAARKRELKVMTDQLKIEVGEFKARSSLIADKDPFIVISLLFRGYADQNKFTPQIGDYAAVIHEGKIYPAICGDYGPSFKMGEASLLMAKTINPKATPYIRPESDLKVTYLIFPGTAEKERSAPDLVKWKEKCQTLLGEVGGVGAGFELYTWEDPFKKPEPPPPATPPAAGAAAPPETPPATPPVAPSTPATPPTATTPPLGAPPASPASISPPATTAPATPASTEPPAAASKSAETKAGAAKAGGTKSKVKKK
jgi:hypothetical protein